MVDTSGQTNIHVTNIHTLTQQALMGGVDETARTNINHLASELTTSQNDHHTLLDMIGQSHRMDQEAQHQTAERLNKLREENHSNVKGLQHHAHQLTEQFNNRINGLMKNFEVMAANLQQYSLKNEDSTKNAYVILANQILNARTATDIKLNEDKQKK